MIKVYKGGKRMNINITIDWKTIAATGFSAVAIILTKNINKEESKDVLLQMISSVKNKLSYE